MKLNGIERTTEFILVHEFYRGKFANRSRVPKIYHVEEGVYLLGLLRASTCAKRAFCLHPMLQDDAELAANYESVLEQCDAPSIAMALEYRNIANQYLSHRDISSIDEIALSPLPMVNVMLIADKVQNYKDFRTYHYGTHAKSERLDQYFRNWLERLGVSLEQFYEYEKLLKEVFPENVPV